MEAHPCVETAARVLERAESLLEALRRSSNGLAKVKSAPKTVAKSASRMLEMEWEGEDGWEWERRVKFES